MRRVTFLIIVSSCMVWVLGLETMAKEPAIKGEIPIVKVKDELIPYLRLSSGKLFRAGNWQYLKDHTSAVSQTSSDGGKTWEPGGRINPGNYGPIARMPGYEIQLQSGPHKGRIVIPAYLLMRGIHPDWPGTLWATHKGELAYISGHTTVPEMSGSFFVYSDDEGKSWKASEGFVMGYFEDGHLGHWSCEEPAIAELKDGRILCFMRSATGRILKSYSSDAGVTWTKVQATDLAMSNSPSALATIPGTGDLVVVWNQMSADEIRAGFWRQRLSLAISKDNGDTWENFKTLELSAGLKDVKRVEPPEIQPMVRGPLGKDSASGELPDDYILFHYPTIWFSADNDKMFIIYKVLSKFIPLDRPNLCRRALPISWLYEK